MPRRIEGWKRHGEAFWRVHHEAWKRSDLNQREYCEAHSLPLKAFSDWRCKFRKEPESPQRKLLYRRGELNRTLSRSLSRTLNHTLSHVAYPSSPMIVPPPREGHRRQFDEADRRRIVEEADQPGASLSEVARRYGIGRRLLQRWKEALSPPVFVTVEVVEEKIP